MLDINQWNRGFTQDWHRTPAPKDVVDAYEDGDRVVEAIVNAPPLGQQELLALENAILTKQLD